MSNDEVTECVKEVVKWSWKRGEWEWLVPSLEDAMKWEKVLSRVPAAIRVPVRKRLRNLIRKLGGEVVPDKITIRVPAGVTVKRSEIRAWWYRCVDETKSELSDEIKDRWKTALQITRGKGQKMEDLMVNATKACREVSMEEGSNGRCVCHSKPELVQAMKELHPEEWRTHGHIHMSAAEVPWEVRAVGNVSMRSEMAGGDKFGKKEFWRSLEEATRRVAKSETTKWVEEARQSMDARSFDKATNDCFNVGSVMEFRRMCERKGALVRTVLDRNPGQLWLTCPALHAQMGRDHFKFAENKQKWDEWETEEDRPNYWKVNETENELLKDWKAEYRKRSKTKCGNRWSPWDTKGKMMQARWQYKQKDKSKLRAIFNGTEDPAIKEMAVAAKCMSLIRKTVGTEDYSMEAWEELPDFLEEAERELLQVYGPDSQLRIDSTDFKNFFPSNKKSDMIKVCKRAVDVIYKERRVSTKAKSPNNTWITIPRGVKEKAVWGRRPIEGATCRTVKDVIEFLDFRAEVANAFKVGDVILRGEEVIIGEKISPTLCDLKAKLDEDDLIRRKLTARELSVMRCKRYVDDGIRLSVINKDDLVESERTVESGVRKLEESYEGITVTAEGEATASGEVVKFLEFAVGLCKDARRLRWFHWNKNVQHLAKTGEQLFKKLRHWSSATFKNYLLGIVRTRFEALVGMTRTGTSSQEQRGAGNFKLDAIQSVKELSVELIVSLGYRVRDLLGLIRRMGHSDPLWTEIWRAMQGTFSLARDRRLVKISEDHG